MNVLSLLESRGLAPVRVSGSKGGEFASPCPVCGGKDRFRAWPEEGPGGRWWCRGCGKSGDALQFLRDFEGLSFGDACRALGRKPGQVARKPPPPSRPREPRVWQPVDAVEPPDLWRQKAAAFTSWAAENLAHPKAGAGAMRFLRSRGLRPETVRAAGLGWSPNNQWRPRAAWGLPEERKPDNRERKLWLPAGIVLPMVRGGAVHRVKVRLCGDRKGPRYASLSGSSMASWTLGQGPGWLVVESELDGLLLHQEAGDLAGVVVLGSANIRPDARTYKVLKEAPRVVVALDYDLAGIKESWGWWAKEMPAARIRPVPTGKDPGEAYQAGANLRAWVAGVMAERTEKESAA
ncbi:MAG: primase-helicase zinc-binding domain-containing protein [Pseudomonadota bacterium]